jgi:putative endonuclease
MRGRPLSSPERPRPRLLEATETTSPSAEARAIPQARRRSRCDNSRVAPWSVYLARCSDGTLYCGVARDVVERIAKHDAGKGARYTRGRGPLVVVAERRCNTHGDALRLELAVKRLAREEKEALADPRRFRALQRAVLGSAQQRKPVE